MADETAGPIPAEDFVHVVDKDTGVPVPEYDNPIPKHWIGTDLAPNVKEGGGPPSPSASKATWVEYAVSQGASKDGAEAATKDELVATYGD